MSISKKEVERIAHLARLDLTEAEKDRFADQLSQILDHVEQLNELDTEGVEPTFQVNSPAKSFQKDQIVSEQTLSKEKVLINAPDKDDQFIKVKPVF